MVMLFGSDMDVFSQDAQESAQTVAAGRCRSSLMRAMIRPPFPAARLIARSLRSAANRMDAKLDSL
jgi:hypothetical protein